MKNFLGNILSYFAKPVQADAPKAEPVNLGKIKIYPKSNATFDQAFPAPIRPADVPDDAAMAMDDACGSNSAMWASSYAVGVFDEGLQFMGYPYLAQLCQRAEYRLISDIRAEEMTRKWIDLRYSGEGDKDEDPDIAAAKIDELAQALDRFDVRNVFRQMIEHDGQFGRGHIYIDTGYSQDPMELATPLVIDKTKIRKGSLKGFRTIEPMWLYPSGFDASNPLLKNFYVPDLWYVNGRNVHRTRILTCVSKPVPDMLKPAYSFGGMSLTQLAKPYVDNWLRTRQSVADLISAFSVMVLSTDLNTLTQGGKCADDLIGRAEMFTTLRDNNGVWMINKESEEFQNVSTSLSSLDKLQAQSQEQMASVARIPLVKFTGMTPSGLNASSDGEIRVFYDTINAEQERIGRPIIKAMIECVMLDIWGKVDPKIAFDFVPLYQLSEKELAETHKLEAETDVILMDGGVISAEESRKRVSTELQGHYSGIDVRDMPEPPEPDEGTDNGAEAENLRADKA